MTGQYLPPVLPAVALITMPFLPFVNTPGLWLGLPRMMVWAAAWSLALVPALRWSQRLMERAEPDSRR
ncbi:hypothetical protein H5P33_04515 [Mycolicibacterium arabiense]|nr:hypothetical protein [Mycolicibacterium arabiense]